MKLRIKKETAVRLFETLGFKTANTWTDDRLLSKVNNLQELIEETDVKIKNHKMRKILKKILTADTIRFKVQEPEEKKSKRPVKTETEIKKKETKEMGTKTKKKVAKKEVQKVAKKKTGKKVAKKKTTKEKVKSTVEKKKKTAKGKVVTVKKEVGIDKFGSRKGTIKAKINAVLTKTPKTMQQLLDAAKVANPQSGHLKDLIENGYVVKTDKGFSIK